MRGIYHEILQQRLLVFLALTALVTSLSVTLTLSYTKKVGALSLFPPSCLLIMRSSVLESVSGYFSRRR